MSLERYLIPIWLPRWVFWCLRAFKRIFVPPARRASTVNVHGERHVEWSFLSREMPDGPGEAIEFGCEQGFMSLLAAVKGFHVIANDLQEQSFTWFHPNVEFVCGDLLSIDIPRGHFDLAINCSSVEHVGVAGRYGVKIGRSDDDVLVMRRLADLLKPAGILLMTVPCGLDTVMAPWCRVYGPQRLPTLLSAFRIVKESYWMKDSLNRWVSASRETALALQPQNDPRDGHGCLYALGCFVLQKRLDCDVS